MDPKEQGQEHTAEQVAAEQAEAQAAFSAGFNGDEPAPAEADPKPDQGTAPAEPAAPAAAADAEADPVVFEGLKASELKAALAKVQDLDQWREKSEKGFQQIYGKFGEIQRNLNQGRALTAPQFKAETFKRLRSEYPELSESLAQDMAEIFAGAQVASATPGLTQEQAAQLIKEREDALRAELARTRQQEVEEQIEALRDVHPDFEQIRDSDDLELWLGTQPQGYRERFRNSQNALFVSQGLTRFKAWKAQGQTHRQRAQNRLERAVQPTAGTAAPQTTLSDREAFTRGFESG